MLRYVKICYVPPGFRHGLKQCFFKYSRFFLIFFGFPFQFSLFCHIFSRAGKPGQASVTEVLGVAGKPGRRLQGRSATNFWGLKIGDPMAFLARKKWRIVTRGHLGAWMGLSQNLGWQYSEIQYFIIIYHHISSYIIIYHHISSYIIIYYIWLVVTGTWLDYDFPFSWESS